MVEADDERVLCLKCGRPFVRTIDEEEYCPDCDLDDFDEDIDEEDEDDELPMLDDE